MNNSPLTTAVAAEATPQLLRSAVDARITKVRPMATPVDQISRLAGARHADSMEVAYYNVDSKPVSTVVKETVNFGLSEFQDDLGKIVKIKVADSSAFSQSDTVMFPSLRLPDGESLTGYVNDVSVSGADHVLSVSVPDNFSGLLNASAPVVRMGRAAAELDVQTPQYVAVPRRSTNFCQIFKMQVEQSTLMRLADKEVAWTLGEQEEAAVIDMRLGMEKNFLFGRKKRILDPLKNEYVYLTGGIWNQAMGETSFPLESASVEGFITLAREIFTCNNGSRKRLLIGGCEFVEAVSKLKLSDKVVVGNLHTKWGLETREIITNFGSLYILHSEVFDQCGHSKDAFVLDQAFLTKYSHIPFRPEKLDLRAAGSRNTDAVVLTEASCLVLRNPSVHFRILGA